MLSCANFFITFGSNLFTLLLIFLFSQKQEYSSLGIVLACRTAPTLFVSLWGGFLADNFNKRNIASLSFLALGIINISSISLIINHGSSLLIYILSLLGGMVSSAGSPSLYSILPFISSQEGLLQANALVRTLRNLGTLSSPGAYALIIFLLGKEMIVGYMSALSVILGAITIFLIKLPGLNGEREIESSSRPNLLTQLVSIKKYKSLFAILVFWALFLPLQAGLANSVQPIFILENFDSNIWLTMSFMLSIGYISGSLIAVNLKMHKRLLEISILFMLLSAFQILASSLLFDSKLLFILSFLAGVGLEISGICWGAYLQSSVPKEDIGKVSSIDYAISFGLIPAGYLLSGFLVSAIGAHEALFYGALLMILSSVSTVAFICLKNSKIYS